MCFSTLKIGYHTISNEPGSTSANLRSEKAAAQVYRHYSSFWDLKIQCKNFFLYWGIKQKSWKIRKQDVSTAEQEKTPRNNCYFWQRTICYNDGEEAWFV